MFEFWLGASLFVVVVMVSAKFYETGWPFEP